MNLEACCNHLVALSFLDCKYLVIGGWYLQKVVTPEMDLAFLLVNLQSTSKLPTTLSITPLYTFNAHEAHLNNKHEWKRTYHVEDPMEYS